MTSLGSGSGSRIRFAVVYFVCGCVRISTLQLEASSRNQTRESLFIVKG